MKALQINPRNSLAFYNLAMSLDRLGQRERAEDVIKKAQHIHPNDPLIREGAALLLGEAHGAA